MRSYKTLETRETYLEQPEYKPPIRQKKILDSSKKIFW